MPTATEGENAEWGKQKREVYLGQANITFPSTATAAAAAAAITIFRCCGVVVSGFATKLIQVDHTPSHSLCPIPLPVPVPPPL